MVRYHCSWYCTLEGVYLLEFCLFPFFFFFSGGTSGVTFEIGGESQPNLSGPNIDGEDENWTGWDCVWKSRTATPVFHMAFSPDGTLFATAGKCDRLVKIWFENKQCEYYIASHCQISALMSFHMI